MNHKVRNVLFVDDEEMVLSALRRVLLTHDLDWNVYYASSAKEALSLLKDNHLDVIVSDMRMPQMDGAELLSRVRDQHPQVARIVLSGQSERSSTLKAMQVAHQFISKPCNPESLFSTVERTLALLDKISSENVRKSFGAIEVLPTPPTTLVRLNKLLENSDCSIDQVAQLVENDTALSAKLLQLVNSAYFGFASEILSVKSATGYMGVFGIRDLATSVLIRSTLSGYSFDKELQAMQSRSIQVANDASAFGTYFNLDQTAFTAGMLHDVGLLGIAATDPETFPELVKAYKLGDDMPTYNGTSHGVLGAYLLSLWGLPFDIVEAVAFQDDVSHLNQLPITAAHLIHLSKHVPVNSECSCLIKNEFMISSGLFDITAKSALTSAVGATINERG